MPSRAFARSTQPCWLAGWLASWLPWLSACRVVFIFLCLCILVRNCIFIFVSLLSGCRRSYLDECGLIQPLCLAFLCCSIIRIFQWLHNACLPLLCHARIRLSLCSFVCSFVSSFVCLSICFATHQGDVVSDYRKRGRSAASSHVGHLSGMSACS